MKGARLIIAALAVLLLTNAVVLGGAAWNRSGAPEAKLALSQSELRLPFSRNGYLFSREDSELALSLDWRIESEWKNNDSPYYSGSRWAPPLWLDADKMASLGFNMTPGEYGLDRGDRLPREVFLVLEFHGGAYLRMLERAVQYQKEQVRKLEDCTTASKKPCPPREVADNLAAIKKNMNSRLFVIDAGLDPEVLRSKYPDSTHYAIVRGKIQPSWGSGPEGKGTRLQGRVAELSVADIHVPNAYRAFFEDKAKEAQGVKSTEGASQTLPSDPADEKGSTAEEFTAEVLFGKRYEPWIDRLTTKGR